MIHTCHKCGAPAATRPLARVPFSDKWACKDGCPVNVRKIIEGTHRP